MPKSQYEMHTPSPPMSLAGVRVLDLSRVLAGPWATQTLGDLGAEIIKIERPGVGDDTRGWGPPFLPGQDGERGDAAYYTCANRNKSSVTVDFTKPEGAALLTQIIPSCDVLVENFKTGGLAKYGLDYETVARLNPRIVYCSITGFGHTGPSAAKPGYDYLVQAAGGLMSVTGQADGTPGAEPLKVGVAVADLFTGLYATIAILAALRHAEATGQGQHIDMALMDCQAAVLANQAANFLVSGTVPGRLGNAHPNIAPYQVFPTADGHLVLAVGNDGQWQQFCAAAGLDVLAQDPRFASNAQRVANRDALIASLRPALLQDTTSGWMRRLEAAQVPCGPIQTIDQVFADPQVIARRMREDKARRDGTAIPLVANPIKMSLTPPVTRRAPPSLGEDTETELRQLLGLSDAQISGLRDRGII